MESAVASVTPGLVVGTVFSQRVQHELALPALSFAPMDGSAVSGMCIDVTTQLGNHIRD
jgi:hypothetical protein